MIGPDGAMTTSVLVANDKLSLEGLRILVAEDESLIAFDLVSTLEAFGCEVVGPLARVEDVPRMAKLGRIDGALLDVNLRGRQIFEVLPELIAIGLKVVLTSGYDDATLFPSAYRGLPRISKPFDERSLRQVCEANFLP
jgi:DNA-binding NarL/FixJ family response regulator